MTNEEASCVLHCPDAYGGIYGQKYGEALAHCFELLKQEPCEDAISRKEVIETDGGGRCMTAREAIDVIKSECYVFNPLNFDRTKMVNTALDKAILALKQSRTIGRWERTEYSPGLCNYHCSECHNISLDIGNYCPNCGAKMSNAEEE